MADDDKPKGMGVSVSLGAEIDKALGDVIRGLLQKPADAVGTILGDGLGIMADKVRLKRERNLQLCLDETRKQLEAKQVDLKDITPPDEEDLHVVLNGVSLAKDDTIRGLWAGLLTSALDPSSQQSVERSITSVIEALTPVDAKIISFLVFAEREDQTCQSRNFKNLRVLQRNPQGKSAPETPEEKQEREDADHEYRSIQVYHAQRVVALAKAYEINYPPDPFAKDQDWHLNLSRLGVIEPTEAKGLSRFGRIRTSADDVATIQTLNAIAETIDNLAKQIRSSDERPYLLQDGNWHVTIGIKLTPFGRKFASACGLFDQPREHWMPVEPEKG